jgi:hypothetical protein
MATKQTVKITIRNEDDPETCKQSVQVETGQGVVQIDPGGVRSFYVYAGTELKVKL